MYASGDINRPASDADVFRLLVEASTDVIVRTGLDGVLTYVSPACRALSYEPEQLVGRSATALVHPDDLERHMANTAKLLTDDQTVRGLD